MLGIVSQNEADELERELDIRFDQFSYHDRKVWNQQNSYLDEYARTRTVSYAADTAGVTVSTAQAWKYLVTLGFTRRLEVADLRFSDRLQVMALERAREPDAPASLLIVLLRAHIPEKYSANGHLLDTSKSDELLFHYRQDAQRELAAGHPTLRAIANGTYQPPQDSPSHTNLSTDRRDTAHPNLSTDRRDTAHPNLSPDRRDTAHPDLSPDRRDTAHPDLSPTGETLHIPISPPTREKTLQHSISPPTGERHREGGSPPQPNMSLKRPLPKTTTLPSTPTSSPTSTSPPPRETPHIPISPPAEAEYHRKGARPPRQPSPTRPPRRIVIPTPSPHCTKQPDATQHNDRNTFKVTRF